MYPFRIIIIMYALPMSKNSGTGSPGVEENLFLKTHQQIYGNRTACYPSAQSVTSLFIATPGWLPQDLFTVDTSGAPCKEHVGQFKQGIQGRCVKLTETGVSEHGDYPYCFMGQGWGCVHAIVPKNDSCAEAQCVLQECRVREGHLTCGCKQQRCIAVTAGRQLMCGECNGTHVSSAMWTYPFDLHQGVKTGGQSRGGGGSSTWNHRVQRPRGNACYRVKQGYVFLFKDVYMTATDRPPTLFSVGTIRPLTVPCPTEGHIQKRIVTRAISAEFCADWRTPVTLGSSLGYGFLGTLSLGGAAGVVSAKNRNFFICGLTILGNSTLQALGAINQELADLRLYTQQTRYAVDYQLARQGGVCTIIKDKCITYVHDETLNITAAMFKIQTQLDSFRQGYTGTEGWLGWLLNTIWGTHLMRGIILVIAFLFSLCLGLTLAKAICQNLTSRSVPVTSIQKQDTKDNEEGKQLTGLYF